MPAHNSPRDVSHRRRALPRQFAAASAGSLSNVSSGTLTLSHSITPTASNLVYNTNAPTLQTPQPSPPTSTPTDVPPSNTPDPDSSQSASASTSSKSALPMGAVIGIAIGSAIAVAVLFALIYRRCRGQKDQRKLRMVQPPRPRSLSREKQQWNAIRNHDEPPLRPQGYPPPLHLPPPSAEKPTYPPEEYHPYRSPAQPSSTSLFPPANLHDSTSSFGTPSYPQMYHPYSSPDLDAPHPYSSPASPSPRTPTTNQYIPGRKPPASQNPFGDKDLRSRDMIALRNLISALDDAADEHERKRLSIGEESHPKPDQSFLNIPLPNTNLFRAALGGDGDSYEDHERR